MVEGRAQVALWLFLKLAVSDTESPGLWCTLVSSLSLIGTSWCEVVALAEVLVTPVLTVFPSGHNIDASFALCPLLAQLDAVQDQPLSFFHRWHSSISRKVWMAKALFLSPIYSFLSYTFKNILIWLGNNEGIMTYIVYCEMYCRSFCGAKRPRDDCHHYWS